MISPSFAKSKDSKSRSSSLYPTAMPIL